MLNLKKVIASICVLAMVLSTVAFGATYTDVAEDSAYYEAVETLNKLEIITGYEDGTFKPEEGVTRAEMAALIARIQGYGATAAGSANTAFADVPASHWASGYVANASGLGIINGYGDGTFGPDEPVLYEQAIKMIMATLGYTPFANENGGYPAGYLAAANRYNVTANVSGGAIGQAACRGTIAQLLVNALDTALMVQSKWNTNGEVEYEIAEGKYNTLTGQTEGYKTLMSENLGFVKIRGIVEETSLIDLTSKTPDIDTTEEAEVYITVADNYGTENKDFIAYYGAGSGYYFVAGTDAEAFLGQSVIAYVKASDSASEKFEIASIAVDSSRNSVLTIALDQFEAYAANEVEYYKDGASKSTFVKTEGDIPVVFNYVGGYTISEISTKLNANNKLGKKFGGEITLIDNDEIKGYDVAVVNLAATAVVKKVTANSITLYNNAKIGVSAGTKTIYVYPEDETKVVTIYKDGEVIDYTDLNEWDILSVYGEAARPSILVAEVISNEVVGTIGATKTSKKSSNGYAYKIGDVWYDVAEGLYDEGIDAGVGGKFYIDEFGKIAAFIEDSALASGATGSYGYVIAVKADEADFGAAGACTVKVQMLTAEGIEVLEVKNNAKLNALTLKVGDWTFVDNNTNTVKDDITGDDYTDDNGGTVTPFDDLVDVAGSVVKYTKDANGNLATVVTAGYQKGAADADFETVAALVSATPGTADKEFDADDISLGNKEIDPEATIFVVGSTIDEYAVVSAADLVDLTKYEVVASYQTKKADDADMIVITFDSFNGVSATTNAAVVAGLSTTTDEDGLTVFAIDYLQDGEAKFALTAADVYDALSADLTVGDMIKVKTTGDVITSISFVYNFGEGVRANTIATGSTVSAVKGSEKSIDEVFDGGAVTNYAERSETVTIGTGNTAKTYRLSKAVNVYTIDNTGRELAVTAGGSFTSLSEEIYTAGGTNKLVDDKGVVIPGMTAVSDSDVQTKYADYVYVRTFEDDVIDVVIVKGYDIIVE